MWKYYNTDELYHYGVLGMKWGHHKSSTYNGPALYNKKHGVVLGLRAFSTADANRRKVKANKRVEILNKKAPGSKRYVKAKVKATKINASRYGRTNGQIIADGILKNIGISAATSIASKTAYKLGKRSVASTIANFGTGIAIGNNITTGIRVAYNYRDKRRKNK